jgi:hypothetical protein
VSLAKLTCRCWTGASAAAAAPGSSSGPNIAPDGRADPDTYGARPGVDEKEEDEAEVAADADCGSRARPGAVAAVSSASVTAAGLRSLSSSSSSESLSNSDDLVGPDSLLDDADEARLVALVGCNVVEAVAVAAAAAAVAALEAHVLCCSCCCRTLSGSSSSSELFLAGLPNRGSCWPDGGVAGASLLFRLLLLLPPYADSGTKLRDADALLGTVVLEFDDGEGEATPPPPVAAEADAARAPDTGRVRCEEADDRGDGARMAAAPSPPPPCLGERLGRSTSAALAVHKALPSSVTFTSWGICAPRRLG